MAFRFLRLLGLTAVAAIASSCLSDPFPSGITPEDQPVQYFFPHGQAGPVLPEGNTLVRASSWTCGDGLEIFDISKPAQPRYVFGLLSAGYVNGMVSRGDYFYISTGYSIMVVRKSSGDRPPELIENMLISFPGGNVRHITIDGALLYTAAPDGLRQYGLLPDGHLLYRRTFYDLRNIISLAAFDGKVIVVLKNDPKNLIFLSPETGKMEIQTQKREVSAIFRQGADLILQCGGQLFRQDGTELFPKRRLRTVRQRPDGTGIEVVLEGRAKGDPLSLVRVGIDDAREIPLPGVGGRSQLTFDGDRMYWTENCLRFGNVNEIAAGGKIYDLPIVSSNGPVVRCGDYLYSIDRIGNQYRLYGFNTAWKHDRSRLTDVELNWEGISKERFYYDIVIPPHAFYRYGNWLLAPEAVLDVSEPAQPKFVSGINRSASCIVPDESGKRLFLAQGSRLTVIDAEKLPQFFELAVIPTDTHIAQWNEVAVKGKYLFANGRDHLAVYDISDLAAPKFLASLDLPGRAYRMVLNGNHLYVPPYASHGGKKGVFRIVDVSDPAHPKVASELQEYFGASVLGIQFYKDKMYVANDIDIFRYDMTDPVHPKLEKTWRGADKAMQSYSYIDVCDGILSCKKYPRFDVWRIEE